MSTLVSTQQIRISDLDHLGHVTAGRIVDVVVNANHGRLTGPSPGEWMICRQEIGYQRPVTGRTVQVHVDATRVGRSSVTLRSVVADEDGRLLAECTTTWVHVDPVTRLPVPVPDALRGVLLS